MDKETAARTIRWMETSGVQNELIEFAYVYVRSALNRLLLGEPGNEIYADEKAIEHNLLGQASAVVILDQIRRPGHTQHDWTPEKMQRTIDRTIVVYAQLLRFIAGMIDEQNAEWRSVLAPFRRTIETLSRKARA